MDVVDQIMKEVHDNYKETKTLSDDVLLALNFLFPADCAVNALDLVERRHVTYFISPSGRGIYQVLGSTGIPYICFLSSNYCGCQAYRFSVLGHKQRIMCKHALAIRISDAMGITKRKEVSDAELSSIIENID